MKTRNKLLLLAAVLLPVVALSVYYYDLYGSDTPTKNREQAEDVVQGWQASPAPPEVVATPSDPAVPVPTTPAVQEPNYNLSNGQTFAVLRVPKLDLVAKVNEGTANAQLDRGVGHYKDTVGPGQTGNFATAGHVCCRSNGQPYKRIHQLQPGDNVIVETPSAIYTYKVLPAFEACGTHKGPGGHTLVTPEQVGVIGVRATMYVRHGTSTRTERTI